MLHFPRWLECSPNSAQLSATKRVYTALSPTECSQCEGWCCIFLDSWLNCGLSGEMDNRNRCLKRVSLSRHRSVFLMWFMAENPDSHDHVLPKSTRNFCATSFSTGNRLGTSDAQNRVMSSFAALKSFRRPGTTLKSMKLSCNAASSTANVCDNFGQIAGSAVKGLAKKQQMSSIAAKSANLPLNAVSKLVSTSASTSLASVLRSASSPQNSLVKLKCRKLPSFAWSLKSATLPSKPLTASYRLHSNLARPCNNRLSLFRWPKMSVSTQSRTRNLSFSRWATGRPISTRKLTMWGNSATNLSRHAPRLSQRTLL